MGYQGSERSTRHVVGDLKPAYRAGCRRVHRPWTTEPGAWLHYDFGDGPVIDEAKTVLFIAWLAWSRFGIFIALRDRTAPRVFAALYRSFRLIGGVPTYVLTDNEKTVTTMHMTGLPVRNQPTLDFAAHYFVEVLTCQPAGPASKGGVKNAVKVAKADLVPKETNLLTEYASFAELEAACAAFMDMVNKREHRTICRRPFDALAGERPDLHPVPATAYTIAHAIGRKVPVNTPMATFENAQYSVPSELLGAEVFVLLYGTGDQGGGGDRPRRRRRTRRGRPPPAGPACSPSIIDAHFPDHDPAKVPGDYAIVLGSAAEAEFRGIGASARSWLPEAAAAGTVQIRKKMDEEVMLPKIAGSGEVDKTLGVAAVHHSFAHGHLASLLNAAGHQSGQHAATEDKSFTQGTSGWAGLGTNPAGATGAQERR